MTINRGVSPGNFAFVLWFFRQKWTVMLFENAPDLFARNDFVKDPGIGVSNVHVLDETKRDATLNASIC